MSAPPYSYQGYQQGSAPPHSQPWNYPQQPPNYGTYEPWNGRNTTTTVVVDAQPCRTAIVTLVPCKPNNYVGLSIFTLLCCCWLFGLLALIQSLQVDAAYARGDVGGASAASRSARMWNIAGITIGSVFVGIAVVISAIVIPVVIVAGKDDYDDYNYDYNYYNN